MASAHLIPTVGPLRSWSVLTMTVAALLLVASCSSNVVGGAAGEAGSDGLVNESSGADPAVTPELLANNTLESVDTDRGCESEETLCIGLAIAPGAIPLPYLLGDLEQIEAEHESIVEVLEAEDVTHLEYKVKDFAHEFFDIIIVAGDPTGLLVSRSATDYPNTTFISMEAIPESVSGAGAQDAAKQGDLTPTNPVTLSFAYQDSGFLAGALAALTTETGKIAAVIGPDSDPAAVQFKTGFETGAQFINPQVQLFTSFHPTSTAPGYNDPLWASTKTRQVIEQGVDVVVGFGGITGSAALVEASRHDGSVLCIGTVVDHQVMTPEANSCLVASAEVGLDHILYSTLDGLLDGDHRSGLNDSEAFSPNPVPATLSIVGGDRVPGDVIAQMDEIMAGLNGGTISSH